MLRLLDDGTLRALDKQPVASGHGASLRTGRPGGWLRRIGWRSKKHDVRAEHLLCRCSPLRFHRDARGRTLRTACCVWEDHLARSPTLALPVARLRGYGEPFDCTSTSSRDSRSANSLAVTRSAWPRTSRSGSPITSAPRSGDRCRASASAIACEPGCGVGIRDRGVPLVRQALRGYLRFWRAAPIATGSSSVRSAR